MREQNNGQTKTVLVAGAERSVARSVLAFTGAIYSNYIFRRFMLLIVVLWLANTAIFFLPRLSGQDPVLEKLYQDAQRGGFLMGPSASTVTLLG